MNTCSRCSAPSNNFYCPACLRDARNHELQKELIGLQRGEIRPKDKDGCAKFILGCIAFILIMMVFHAPSAWFAHKVHEIDWSDAIWASIGCAEGWYGAILTWLTVAAILGAIFSIIAKEFKPVLMVPVVILSSFTVLYVWNHLDVIKVSHDSRKAKSADRAAAEGYTKDQLLKSIESGR